MTDNIENQHYESRERKMTPNIEKMADSPELVDLKSKIEELKRYYPPRGQDYPGLTDEEFENKFNQFMNDPDRDKKRRGAEKRLGGDLYTLKFLYYWQKNKNVGLDPESLFKIRNDLMKFWGEEDDSKVGTCYIPDIALIHKLLGDDLTGKIIVEVGPWREGIDILSYFASRGAKVIAIDVQYPGEEFLKECPDVKFVHGRWENIEELMKSEKADVVYTHFMHPNPEAGGKFNRNKEAFEEYTRQAMDRILVPGGVYFGHHVENDYVLHYPSDFIKQNNYRENSFSSIIEDRQADRLLEKTFGVSDFKKLKKCQEKAPFYGWIYVVQKPE